MWIMKHNWNDNSNFLLELSKCSSPLGQPLGMGSFHWENGTRWHEEPKIEQTRTNALSPSPYQVSSRGKVHHAHARRGTDALSSEVKWVGTRFCFQAVLASKTGCAYKKIPLMYLFLLYCSDIWLLPLDNSLQGLYRIASLGRTLVPSLPYPVSLEEEFITHTALAQRGTDALPRERDEIGRVDVFVVRIVYLQAFLSSGCLDGFLGTFEIT